MRVKLSRLALGFALCIGLPAHAAGTLTVCTDGAPEGFDIVQYEGIVTADATAGIFEQLIAFKKGSSAIEPGLAERWDLSADGLQVTLHLRRGVKFHTTAWFKPSREMNADDVLWSVNRINNARHPAHGVARAGYVYWAGMSMPSLIKSLDKIDAYTVRFTLTRPDAPFLANLAMSAIGSVYSAEYAEQLLKAGKLDQLNTLPVGTGPFALRSYQKDTAVRYVAHPGHWAGAPAIDAMVFAITPDPNVRAQRVKAGECLVAINMKRDAVAGFEGGDMRVVLSLPLLTSFISPNTQRPFLSDRRFRQALQLGIDRGSFISAVYGGLAKPAGSLLPPAMWSHDASLQPRFDSEPARKLVAASGYDGRELTLMFRNSGSLDGRRAGELLQADWARIGVKVKVRLVEVGELLRLTGKGEHDLANTGWASDNGDPDNFFTPNLSCAAVDGGGNKGRWCHPPLDKLLDEARRNSDLKRRTELYVSAQRLVRDEAPMILTVYPSTVAVLHQRVSGFVISPFSTIDLRGVRLN